MVANPGKMIASALGSLTQPLFNQGANTARLRIAKAQQQEALLSFQQAILNAGSEVSNALCQYQSAEDKIVQRKKQINSLEKSVEYTQELLTLGTSTYLEVLTAQQSLAQRPAVERIRPVRSHTGHRQPVQRIGRRTQPNNDKNTAI